MCNPYSFLDDTYGCWSALSLPRWFTFTTQPSPGPMVITLTGDLCHANGNCGCVRVHYTIFSACIEDGGTVVSGPFHRGDGVSCWDEFGDYEATFDYYIRNSCSTSTTYLSSPPSPSIPGVADQFQIHLSGDTQYWMAIYPSGNCVSQWSNADDVYVWGCMTLQIDGPTILGDVNLSVISEESGFPYFSVWPTEAIIERSYNLITWQPINQNPDVDIDPIPDNSTVYYRAHHNGSYSDMVAFSFNPTGFQSPWWKTYDFAGRRIR